jgi:shikimate kinase
VTSGNRQIVLIGMMGVGKTTIGRRLADRLGWEFWDNDEALGEATGRTASEVQQTDGQETLHRLEDRLLRSALASPTPTVLAAAASVVLDPDVVSGALTVWLRASAAREARNVALSGQHHRPLPADAEDLLRRLEAEREPLYTQLADVVVDVAAEPAATCDRVMEALAELGIEASR